MKELLHGTAVFSQFLPSFIEIDKFSFILITKKSLKTLKYNDKSCTEESCFLLFRFCHKTYFDF